MTLSSPAVQRSGCKRAHQQRCSLWPMGGTRTVEPVIKTLAIENYRSLRRLVVPLATLNVVTGANGSGKSSLYRALRLLADSSRNGAVAALAREGGLPSTLLAGPAKARRALREGRYPVQGTVRSEAHSGSIPY
jgi:predicted ATPase